jgi:hypothetical protein
MNDELERNGKEAFRTNFGVVSYLSFIRVFYDVFLTFVE